MRRFRKQFAKASTWIGAIIMAAVFLPRDKGQLAMAAFTLLWLCVKLTPPCVVLLNKCWQKVKAVLKRAEQNGAQQEEVKAEIFKDTPLMKEVINRQLAVKVTDKLRLLYPDVSWSWLTPEEPYELAASGRSGRIKTAHTEPYNQAEVSFLRNGQIEISMMTVTALEQVQAAKTTEEMTLEEWYEQKALIVLKDCIDELYCRGIKTMTLSAKGEIQSDDGVHIGAIECMPSRDKWPQLAELMAADDIRTFCQPDDLVLSWGAW